MKEFRWKYAMAFLLPVEIVVFYIISNNKAWVENYYVPYVFKNLTVALRMALGKIDFSIGLVSFYILLFVLLFKLVQRIQHLITAKKTWNVFRDLILRVITILGVVFGIYMVMWGFCYHRKPIAEIVTIDTENISSQDLAKLCERLIYLTNESRKKVPNIRFQSYRFRQLFKKAPEGYTHISKRISELTYERSSIKMGFTKGIMSSFKTAGIYFPFTAEANINGNLTSFEAPFVICHEMAHQLGFASEDEANYIAYLACVKNPDPVFKFSANYWVLFSAMNALKKADFKTYDTLSSKIDPEVFHDNEFSQSISKRFRSPARDFISRFLYDIFLKANSQKSGIESYNLVIKLLVGEFRKNGLQYSSFK